MDNAEQASGESLAAPTTSFVYTDDGRVAGEFSPLLTPAAHDFLGGLTSAAEYLSACQAEEEANDRLRRFMRKDQLPDFMLSPSRPARSWRPLGALARVLLRRNTDN